MPGITIDATAGGSASNSFASETEYIAYTATLINVPVGTTVSGSTCTETEKKALVMSFRAFNELRWKARKTSLTQSGAWPQFYAENPDAPGLWGTSLWYGMYWASDLVPDRVKFGQIELALAILGAGTTDIFAADPNQGIVQETVDVITTKWTDYARPVGLYRFPQVMAQIGPMLDSTSGGILIQRM